MTIHVSKKVYTGICRYDFKFKTHNKFPLRCWNLCMMIKGNVKKVIKKGDALNNIHILKDVAKIGWNGRDVIAKIKHMLRNLDEVSFQYTYHEVNHVANMLVTVGK